MPAPPSSRPGSRDAVAAGIAGAALCWEWLLASDVASGAPLRTPERLGHALFGIGPAAHAPSRWMAVAAFTLLHALVWIGLAALVGRGFRGAARTPSVLVLVVALSVYVQFAWMLLSADLAADGLGGRAWRDVLAGNAVGWTGLAWVLLRRHPELRDAWTRAADD